MLAFKKNSRCIPCTNGKHNMTDDIIHEYNSWLEGYPRMRLEGGPAYVFKKCKELNSIFSQKWYPQEMLHKYIAIFSHNSWKKCRPLRSSSTLSQGVNHVLASFLHWHVHFQVEREHWEREIQCKSQSLLDHTTKCHQQSYQKKSWPGPSLNLHARANRAVSGLCFTKHSDSCGN